MNAPKRKRARILTASGLKKLREQLRSHEVEANAGFKYTLERLGELTGLDPETVKNVLDCKGSDKRTIARCFETFGMTLAESDHIPAAQATTIADPNFVGRDEAIADLDTLVSRNARVIVIQARGGVGKTTLARKYLQQEFGSFLEFPIAKETKDIASIEGLLEEKLRQLGEEPGREFLVSLDRLKRKLQAERIGILIDNLEPALDSAGKFIEAHRRYVELLRVLSDPTVQSLTLITSRERLREADVTVQHYPLRSLSVPAWTQFFQSRSINVETTALAALHNAYGGNAKAMDIIGGTVLEDFSGDVEAYWWANQDDLFIERDLEDLVAKQFDRLQDQDPDAYKLLCRMGCYRYQDIPTVSIKGLFCLLWNVPENRHRRVIKSLLDRSLIDFEDGEFWLHPVIRAEAISRLRGSAESEMTNCKAARFWTDSIKTIELVEEAMKAMESYYHYIEINQFESASQVILKERNNTWIDQSLFTDIPSCTLGASLIRLGLFQQMAFIINRVIHKVQAGCSLSKLYNLLGDAYWLAGKINQSINCHEESGKIATHFACKDLEIAFRFNIALCMEDLWEVQESKRLFEEVILHAENTEYKNFAIQSWYCLAHLCSRLGLKQETAYFVEKVCDELSETSLGIRTTGYRFFALGRALTTLENYKEALGMYQKSISYAEKSSFSELKGITLFGLAELYRVQKSYKIALSYNTESIHILDKLGAKRHLGEAYYEIGLTYQALGKVDESSKSFQEAIRLFGEMEAPKQVERVKQSMQY